MKAEIRPFLDYVEAVAGLEAEREKIENRHLFIVRDDYERWVGLASRVETPPDACPDAICTRERRQFAARMVSRIPRREAQVQLNMSSTARLKLAYADLRESGQAVSIPSASARADTYHNCAYRSQSRYRSFRVATADDPLGLHAYCRRGDEDCERWYQAAINGVTFRQVVMTYRRYNRVCEEGQANLIGAFH